MRLERPTFSIIVMEESLEGPCLQDGMAKADLEHILAGVDLEAIMEGGANNCKFAPCTGLG